LARRACYINPAVFSGDHGSALLSVVALITEQGLIFCPTLWMMLLQFDGARGFSAGERARYGSELVAALVQFARHRKMGSPLILMPTFVSNS
jgi:hypothetical protein